MPNKYIIEQYFHIKGTPDIMESNRETRKNYIKATLKYDLGGTNIFTYKNEPRGYYMYIQIIDYQRHADCGGYRTEGFMLTPGYSATVFLVECARQSKKKETEAIKLFNEYLFPLIKKKFPDIEIETEPEGR